jgi:N-methylhydantoinase A
MSVGDAVDQEIADAFAALESDATDRLTEQGFDASTIRHRHALDLRYHGQEHTVRLALDGIHGAEMVEAAFHGAHQQQYTFALEGTPIEIVNFRLTSTVDHRRPMVGRIAGHGTPAGDALVSGQRCIDVDSVRVEATIYRRDALPLGFRAEGPAIVEEPSATTLVLPGQSVDVDGYGNLVISSIGGRS